VLASPIPLHSGRVVKNSCEKIFWRFPWNAFARFAHRNFRHFDGRRLRTAAIATLGMAYAGSATQVPHACSAARDPRTTQAHRCGSTFASWMLDF